MTLQKNSADPLLSCTTGIAQPMSRETVNTIINGEVVKVYKDEVEKQLYHDLYQDFGLNPCT